MDEPAAPTDEPAPADPATTDSDGDAIVDARDACPSEAENYNSTDDEDGCPECADRIVLIEAWSLPTIRFRAGSEEIARTHQLDFTAAVIRAHTEYAHVEIVGSTGAGERSGLAAQRAEAVLRGLLARGVAADRLSTTTSAAAAATVTFTITYAGSAYPLCNTPFVGCAPDTLEGFVMFSYPFALGSAELGAIDDRVAVLDYLEEATDWVRIEVTAYTTPRERGGHALALARANAVIEHLVAAGIARERLIPIDGGELDQPRGYVSLEHLTSAGCLGIPAG